MSEKTIVEKIISVIKTMGAVPKTGRNDFQKYNYRKHEDIVNALHSSLVENGIIIVPKEKKIHLQTFTTEKDGKQSNYVILDCVYSVTDGMHSIDFVGIGEGKDYGDKAFYKAQTGAFKYALNDMLALASETDPEKEDEPRKEESVIDKKPLSEKNFYTGNNPTIPDSAGSQMVDMMTEMGWTSTRQDKALLKAKTVGEGVALKAITDEYHKFKTSEEYVKTKSEHLNNLEKDMDPEVNF
jgi:hypothetical protein